MITRCSVLLVAALATACGGSKATTPTSPTTTTGTTPPPSGGTTTSFDVNGTWTGSAGGGRLTFTVANNGVTVMTLSQFPGCSTIYGFSLTAPISANAFSYTIPSGNPDLSGTISGRFASASSASGDMNITAKTGCLGNRTTSWTATK